MEHATEDRAESVTAELIDREADDAPTINLPAFNEGLGRQVVISDRASAFLPVALEDIRAVAEMLAGMPGTREAFKTPKACEAIVLQAALWRISPLFLLQGAYQAKPDSPVAYEAKVLDAVILSNAPLSRRPRLKWGYADKNNRTLGQRFCEVTFWVVGEDEPIRHRSPTVAQIKVKNSPLWFSDTDVQLGYYVKRAAARLHFPDVLGGAYTREEALSMRSIEALPAPQMFPDEIEEPIEAEFEDAITPTKADLEAQARWEKKASGEQDSRDPRDAPQNNGPGPDAGDSGPKDLAELRAWAATEHVELLRMTDPVAVGERFNKSTIVDKRWGRLKTYDPDNAKTIKDEIFAHVERLKEKK